MRLTSLSAAVLISSGALFAQTSEPKPYTHTHSASGKTTTTPLPDRAQGRRTKFVDLNGDGYDDLIVSNAREYGVYLFVSKEREKKNLQWFEGWTQVLREGTPGDANSLPLISDSMTFKDNAMIVGGGKSIPFAELLKVPGPHQSRRRIAHDTALEAGLRSDARRQRAAGEGSCVCRLGHEGPHVVVEMGDYPFAAGEKTTNGETGQGKVSDLQTGRIKILEDTNDDGIYDKATLFLDGLTHPTSLAPWKNGVFVASIPDVFYAEDTDGDGKCDKREAWFSGFTAGNPQHLVNGFAWGLDGWFYGANGDSGGSITARRRAKTCR